jgi:hypothetical protein
MIRDPIGDHLLTPKNAALKNIVSTVNGTRGQDRCLAETKTRGDNQV